MAIGKRIRYFRTRLHMSQKEFGMRLGFTETTAESRISQYESYGRKPRMSLIEKMSNVLRVSVYALLVPDIDSRIGLMHTLFAIEDMYGITIDQVDDEVVLRISSPKDASARLLKENLSKWCIMRVKFEAGILTQQDYDDWRYNLTDIHRL